ncbi:MAG: YihY/virulence factor BrkB family protein [Candidatus Nealsonbacteria bacterium]|nr:YihY/virulence factor BrkB family protein [Candidatus Nealsonbacteria bacterium]
MLAAAMAYYAVLSLFPLLLILISVLGFVLRFSPGAQDAQQQLLELLAENTSAAIAQHVGLVLAEVRMKATVGGPLGVLTLLLAAIGIFTQLERAFDRIWNVEKPGAKGIVAAVRNVLCHRLRGFLMMLGVGLLIVVAFTAGAVASVVRSLAIGLPHGTMIWSLVEILLSVAVNCLLFTLIYKILPKARVRWVEAVQGAAVAAVLWEVNRQVLAALVIGEKYSAYGIIGSVIALLLWVYLASSILFFGAEYVRVGRGGQDENRA